MKVILKLQEYFVFLYLLTSFDKKIKRDML